MATLAAVYDAEPAVRGADDLIRDPDTDLGPAPEPERRPGPKARSKWLTGSVNDTPAEVVTAAFDQSEHRDPGHRRSWVVLVDGARHQLDLITAEAVLKLRALRSKGHFDAYWTWHEQEEFTRNHQARYCDRLRLAA
ncbi:hypothetical protein [Streptomyces sp. NPDC056682]|uniref:hypothetical protein n=1 Tax=Streptomyces sp. NPDC056682 TaxID=3345909 RepID=UPI0036B7A22D